MKEYDVPRSTNQIIIMYKNIILGISSGLVENGFVSMSTKKKNTHLMIKCIVNHIFKTRLNLSAKAFICLHQADLQGCRSSKSLSFMAKHVKSRLGYDKSYLEHGREYWELFLLSVETKLEFLLP